ncbi:hypothetical protein D3C87_2111350 [compost metagenome]
MGGILGQTPWALMNQLTERNLAMWNEFQRNLSSTVGQSPNPPGTGNSSKPKADTKR